MMGVGLIRALGVTMKNFVRPSFTVQYPDRKVGLLGAARRAEMSPLRFLMSQPRDGIKALAFMLKAPERVPQFQRFRGNEFAWYETRCTGCASCGCTPGTRCPSASTTPTVW